MRENDIILGLKIYNLGISNFKTELYESLKKNQSISVHLCNAYTIALASQKNDLYRILKNSSYNLPDGKPLSKILNPYKNIQIMGMNLVSEILSDKRFQDMKHLFYGSDNTGSQLLKKYLDAEYENQDNIYCVSAPYLEVDDFDIEDLTEYCEFNDIKFIWVGLGTPKQDFLVDRIVRSTKNPVVAIPIGAVFDFLIGRKAKSPVLISKMGFEWLFRLISEPRRLSKRYIIYNSIFLLIVMKSLLCCLVKNFKQFWKN